MILENSAFEFSVLDKINGFLYRCKADEAYTMIGLTSGIERIFGYPVADLIGNRVRTYSSIIHRDDVKSVDDAVNQGLASRTNYDIDYRLVAADGRAIWVHETGGGIWDERGELCIARALSPTSTRFTTACSNAPINWRKPHSRRRTCWSHCAISSCWR